MRLCSSWQIFSAQMVHSLRFMVNSYFAPLVKPYKMLISFDGPLPLVLWICQQVLPHQFNRMFQLFMRISCIVRILWVMYLMTYNLCFTYLFWHLLNLVFKIVFTTQKNSYYEWILYCFYNLLYEKHNISFLPQIYVIVKWQMII